MASYYCTRCGYIYDEERGHPRSEIPPGTKWEDIPSGWSCPDCGASKDEFERE